jgi:hypothetical protein
MELRVLGRLAGPRYRNIQEMEQRGSKLGIQRRIKSRRQCRPTAIDLLNTQSTFNELNPEQQARRSLSHIDDDALIRYFGHILPGFEA